MIEGTAIEGTAFDADISVSNPLDKHRTANSVDLTWLDCRDLRLHYENNCRNAAAC